MPGLVMPPALKYPAYRIYWLGTVASVLGFQTFNFGQLWLMHKLESAPIFLGYVGLAQAVPAITLNLFGGVFADRVNRRTLLIFTQFINAALILALAVLTTTGMVVVWHILAIAFIAGAVNAFDQPARQAIFPHLIERKALMSAVALNSSVWQGSRIVAPAVAGLVIAIADTEAAFYMASAGFVAMALVMVRLRVPQQRSTSTASPARDLLEGVGFIRRNSVFTLLIGMTFFNSFFGMAYILLMPVFAVDILGVGSEGQGLLLAASGVGALGMTFWLSTQSTSRHRGTIIVGASAAYGLSIAVFAISAQYTGSYSVALGIMLISGVFNSLYMVPVMSSLQMLVPDTMRGRVMGFFGMTYNIMPLGALLAGAVAGVVGTPAAVAAGGLVVTTFALGPALASRHLRRISELLHDREAAAQTTRA